MTYGDELELWDVT